MRKGFANAEEVETFLRPRLSSLSDPFLLPNMQTAVDRILAGLDRKDASFFSAITMSME